MLRYGGKELIEEFMSESTGKAVKMVMRRDDADANKRKNAEAVRASEQLSRILDFDVKIK